MDPKETIAKVDELLAHPDDPDFMEKLKALQPHIHTTTDTLTQLALQRLAEGPAEVKSQHQHPPVGMSENVAILPGGFFARLLGKSKPQ